MTSRPMSARGSSTDAPVERAVLRHRRDHGLGPELVGNQIDLDAVARQPLRRAAADGAQPRPLQRAHVARAVEERGHERLDGVGAREHDPVEALALRGGAQQRIGIVRRHDADHRRFDRFGAQHRQPVDHLGRLIARPRHEHALAEQRPRVEPAQVIAEADHAADDENRRPAPRLLARRARAAPSIVPATVSWLGERAVVDDDRLIVAAASRWPACASSMRGSCCAPA